MGCPVNKKNRIRFGSTERLKFDYFSTSLRKCFFGMSYRTAGGGHDNDMDRGAEDKLVAVTPRP